jgi:hypothetical protein
MGDLLLSSAREFINYIQVGGLNPSCEEVCFTDMHNGIIKMMPEWTFR